MSRYQLLKPFFLAALFIKEQLKEPVALFWIVFSPVVTFYLISYARGVADGTARDYLSSTSWFYAFVSSSVALFGLAFYIVGRRESGFIRSFIYTPHTKVIFLVGQFLAYSVMAVIYCSVFYVSTRFYFGAMSGLEFLSVLARFYVCFILFSTPALLLTLIPMGFQNTHTLLSIVSFVMLALGVTSINAPNAVVEYIKVFNPMWWANEIMRLGVSNSMHVVCMAFFLMLMTFGLLLKYLIINPVWSRY